MISRELFEHFPRNSVPGEKPHFFCKTGAIKNYLPKPGKIYLSKLELDPEFRKNYLPKPGLKPVSSILVRPGTIGNEFEFAPEPGRSGSGCEASSGFLVFTLKGIHLTIGCQVF